MDQSIRLRRPEDDIADQLEEIRAWTDLCKNMSQMYERLPHPAFAPGGWELPAPNRIEVGHGNR